jgi:hypothetical protein
MLFRLDLFMHVYLHFLLIPTDIVNIKLIGGEDPDKL